MTERTIPISRFKAECLSLLEEVARTGAPLVITKRGRSVARVVPTEEPPTLRGSIIYRVPDRELIAPIDESWDAER